MPRGWQSGEAEATGKALIFLEAQEFPGPRMVLLERIEPTSSRNNEKQINNLAGQPGCFL
jgi:hypothetical protein